LREAHAKRVKMPRVVRGWVRDSLDFRRKSSMALSLLK